MPNRESTPLERINVADYEMNPSEQIAAAALKYYFVSEPLEGKQELEQIFTKRTFILNFMDPTAIKDDKALLISSDINGKKLAKLIDTASSRATAAMLGIAMKGDDSMFALKAGMAASKIEGKASVFNASAEFLDFLSDCCAAMYQ